MTDHLKSTPLFRWIINKNVICKFILCCTKFSFQILDKIARQKGAQKEICNYILCCRKFSIQILEKIARQKSAEKEAMDGVHLSRERGVERALCRELEQLVSCESYRHSWMIRILSPLLLRALLCSVLRFKTLLLFKALTAFLAKKNFEIFQFIMFVIARQLRVQQAFLDDPDPFSFAVTCPALLSAADQGSLIPDSDSSFFVFGASRSGTGKQLNPALYIKSMFVW
jgi:hypothetical protein